METNHFESKRKLQVNRPITILTIVSLVSTVICNINYFVRYTSSGGSSWELEFSLGHDTQSVVISLIDYFIYVAPIVVFSIYIFKLYSQYKADIAVSITLGLIAVIPIYEFIMISLVLELEYVVNLNRLIDLMVVVSFILAVISSLKGFSKKVYIKIAVVCGVLSEIISLVSYIGDIGRYMEEGLYLYLFTRAFDIIGNCTLYIALLIFCLNNEMHMLIKKEKNEEKMTPEQSLRDLKEKLDLGVITEEEYQAQRAEIISKL